MHLSTIIVPPVRFCMIRVLRVIVRDYFLCNNRYSLFPASGLGLGIVLELKMEEGQSSVLVITQETVLGKSNDVQ
jgi:hypothetical protein